MVGLFANGLQEYEGHSSLAGIWRVRLWSRFLPNLFMVQVLKYFEWGARIIFRFWRQEIRIIHAHSLEALPISVVLKTIRGAKLVYDAHELETERNGLSGIRKKLCQLTERTFIRYADEVLVVSEPIAQWYRRKYKRTHPVVVRNIPNLEEVASKEAPSPLREKLGLSDKEIIFIYLGGLGQGRGIRAMIQAFEDARAQFHIVFIGEGELEDEIKDSQKRSRLIHIIPAVPPDDVLAYAAGADVGCCLIEDTCLSYRYSLPNKLFEYLKAGLPVLINDLPEQRKIVEKFNCGWVFEEKRSLLDFIREEMSPKEIESKREGVSEAKRTLDWAHEEKKLASLYRAALYGVK